MAHTPTPNIAASMYGPDPAPEAETTPVLTKAQIKDQALAEAIYAKPMKVMPLDLPPAVAALRRQEDDGIYDRATGYESIPFAEALADLALPPEELAANVQGYKDIAADVGASPALATQFLDITRQLINNPPDEVQAEAMRTEALKAVRDMHGEEADGLLNLARRMVQRDPRLQRILNVTHAGSDKRVVLEAIELAKQQRAAGRLK